MPERFFKDAEGIIEWHKTYYPESYKRYVAARKKIKDSKFSGSSTLLRNLDSNKTVTNFLSFLTELNLANLFLDKGVTDLSYEPKSILGVDFVFRDLTISVKNLHPKNYEKADQDAIDALRAAGGGRTTLVRKGFSNIAIEVKETGLGTFTWERTEMGQSGFLDSDVDEMSTPLKYIGEFEDTETDKRKKVLFFFIQSKEFSQYYIQDIVIWYFDYHVENYPPIFRNDTSWYMKLLSKPVKKGNIDALVFMYTPNTSLSWPPDCLKDIGKESRLQIYTPDKALHEQLRALF